MPAVTGPALVVAGLLIVAGAQKVVDPTMTVGALRSMGLPVSPLGVRAGSAAELSLGLLAVVNGGRVAWGLVALSYVAFAAFVLAALRRGTMIGTCGCFGREETPPHVAHVALNAFLAGVAAWAVTADGRPADALARHPGSAIFVLVLAALATGLLYAAYVLLPRALSVEANRPTR